MYLHNSESVLENEIHKIFWDFDIQTNHLILARRPDLVIVNRKKRREPAKYTGAEEIRNTDDSTLFTYETFINFLTLVFRHEERETQFFLC